ncbi:MAG TPA: hypothetical protein VEX13_15840 [Chloroflexia bacterium]|nr:hypothetical protein [Chloroflexia bacterium]
MEFDDRIQAARGLTAVLSSKFCPARHELNFAKVVLERGRAAHPAARLGSCLTRGPFHNPVSKRMPMPAISAMLSRTSHSRQQVLTLHDNSPPGLGARLL